MERSEETWIKFDRKVKCEHRDKENVTRKTRRRRWRCERKARRRKTRGQESIKGRKRDQKMRAKKQ